MRLRWLAPAAIVLSACATAAPVAFDIAKFDALKPGVTTKAEAIAILGAPSSTAPSLNDHTTLIYDYAGAAEDLKMVVLFDADEKFVRYRAYGVAH